MIICSYLVLFFPLHIRGGDFFSVASSMTSILAGWNFLFASFIFQRTSYPMPVTFPKEKYSLLFHFFKLPIALFQKNKIKISSV